jgi:hypothetical protein
MKTILLFLCLSSALTLNAQTWAPIGATWHFRSLWTVLGAVTDGSTEVKTTSTVSVNGKICSKLSSKFRGATYLNYPGVPPPVVAVVPGPEYITYMESDVIYLYNGTDFDTIVDLKAKPGDHWTVPNYIGGCDSLTPVVVTDTGHILLNGINLRQIGLTFKKRPAFTPYLIAKSYTFTERVGSMNAFLFPTVRCVTDDPGDPFFSCYTDDNFSLIKGPGVTECDLTTVGIIKHEKESVFSLYPNPSTGVITVQTSRPATVQIVDYLGRIMYSNNEVHAGINQIDTDLAKGVYFLQLTSDSQKQMIRFVRE